jgi:hypothetical protein
VKDFEDLVLTLLQRLCLLWLECLASQGISFGLSIKDLIVFCNAGFTSKENLVFPLALAFLLNSGVLIDTA